MCVSALQTGPATRRARLPTVLSSLSGPNQGAARQPVEVRSPGADILHALPAGRPDPRPPWPGIQHRLKSAESGMSLILGREPTARHTCAAQRTGTSASAHPVCCGCPDGHDQVAVPSAQGCAGVRVRHPPAVLARPPKRSSAGSPARRHRARPDPSPAGVPHMTSPSWCTARAGRWCGWPTGAVKAYVRPAAGCRRACTTGTGAGSVGPSAVRARRADSVVGTLHRSVAGARTRRSPRRPPDWRGCVFPARWTVPGTPSSTPLVCKEFCTTRRGRRSPRPRETPRPGGTTAPAATAPGHRSADEIPEKRTLPAGTLSGCLTRA